ncbi:MAG: glycoside hydrolase family 3 C-terminal domain-containing protein [Bacteroidales bacterium]|nr:glycoside hydrolase family 3 C-terminal domain-containing protein [Bacteroidales bacterium]MCI2121857.1 glycoside hydrolase family 3 C-terminal domain-containing protein [Bacteroidales bacterium]MCI2145120.1 glycoside hydrolase family 3 C-terminal domain-containing protein [Bacteroidales bacterium]
MMKRQILLIVAGLTAGFSLSAQPSMKRNSDIEVIKTMKLIEKASMVCGTGWNDSSQMVTGVAGTTFGLPEYGITNALLTDGPAGVRINVDQFGTKVHTTAFPVNTAMAATWDLALEEAVGAAVGEEIKDLNMDAILAPAINIQRNPLCGRNFEYYSEDPLLAGKMAASYIRGVQSEGVGATLKHFVANNSETNRFTVNCVVSQRALREIYLRAFEIAVREGRPWAVMTSYNRLNGFYTSQNHELLKDVLRGDWNYNGMVMTDWGGGNDPVAQMKAGNDLLMPGNYDQIKGIVEAVKDKVLDEATLDENIGHILTFVRKTPRYRGYQPTLAPDFAAHRKLVRKAGAEGMVLLKNSGSMLPVASRKKVALFGKGSYATAGCGTGSGYVNAEHFVTLEEGMANSGYRVDETLKSAYGAYIKKAFADWKETEWYFPKEAAAIYATEMEIDEASVRAAAVRDNFAVITIQRCSGEGWDRKEKDYFELSPAESDLISEVTAAFHARRKKVVVVLNVSSAIETVSWRDKVDAILVSWLPGEEAGNSIADVLTGKVSPCGRLPMTFPEKYSDEPSTGNFPGEPADNPANVFYSEGIYVGYRYFATVGVKAAYPFGYGLSYATFKYSNMWVDPKFFPEGGKVTVSFSVTNVGKKAGREVCELYVEAPNGTIDKPVYELKGFAKTRLLQPGEFENVSIEINSKEIASYWSGMHAWVADEGEYKVSVGSSPTSLPLESIFTVRNRIVVETTSDVLYPNLPVEDMEPRVQE